MFQGLGSAFNEVFCFFQTEAGDSADFLDDFDLLVAGGGENDRELGLLFNRSSGGGGRSSRATDEPATAGGGLDLVLVLQIPGQLDGLLEGQAASPIEA